MSEWDMLQAWKVGELRIKFWSENLRLREHFSELGVYGRRILKWTLTQI
jgi:hypothetical protein